jgi:hypothetical protein
MDIYDGAEWTEMDIEDLKSALEHGSSIEDAAEVFMSDRERQDVAIKVVELGLSTAD